MDANDIKLKANNLYYKSSIAYLETLKTHGEAAAVAIKAHYMNQWMDFQCEAEPTKPKNQPKRDSVGLYTDEFLEELLSRMKRPCTGEFEACSTREVTQEDVERFVGKSEKAGERLSDEDFDMEIEEIFENLENSGENSKKLCENRTNYENSQERSKNSSKIAENLKNFGNSPELFGSFSKPHENSSKFRDNSLKNVGNTMEPHEKLPKLSENSPKIAENSKNIKNLPKISDNSQKFHENKSNFYGNSSKSFENYQNSPNLSKLQQPVALNTRNADKSPPRKVMAQTPNDYFQNIKNSFKRNSQVSQENKSHSNISSKNDPVYKSDSVYKSDPVYNSDPINKSDPVHKSDPINKSDPVHKSDPINKSDPVYKPDPAYKINPTYKRNPIYKSDPVYKRPDPQKPSNSTESPSKDSLAITPDMYKAFKSARNINSPAGSSNSINKPFQIPVKRPENNKIPQKNPEEDPLLADIDPEILKTITAEVVETTKDMTWDDIAGLDAAKEKLKHAVILPLKRPDLFSKIRSGPKGILLFGPPGTGKTLIGKCIASQANATFLSVSSSTLTSKWIGQGEKLVRALFRYARAKQPAVIFIDEIDSILMKRSETEHESSRRLKTEFLIQLDGAFKTDEDDRIVIIGATNRPQELDDAARRRFTQRLYIPLPCFKGRKQLMLNLVGSVAHDITEEDSDEIAEATEGYSGSDLAVLVKESALAPLYEMPLETFEHVKKDKIRNVNINDFRKSLLEVKASVNPEDLEQYQKWNTLFGSTR